MYVVRAWTREDRATEREKAKEEERKRGNGEGTRGKAGKENRPKGEQDESGKA